MRNPHDTPNIDDALFAGIDPARLFAPGTATHPPRILILYGSLRARSFSRLSAEEAGRILTRLGAEVRFFNPSGLPLVDEPGADLTKVEESEFAGDLHAAAPIRAVMAITQKHLAQTDAFGPQLD